MPRTARIVLPGYPHHVTQRGSRRQQVFFGERDYVDYLHLLEAELEHLLIEIWAYCLMPNHVHFIAVPDNQESMSKLFQSVHRKYARAINAREGWQGHLWQERYHSYPMDEQHLLATARYIELNPVRAGLCSRPTDWPWSSARAHFYEQDTTIVKSNVLLSIVGDWRTFMDQERSISNDTIRVLTKSGKIGGNIKVGDSYR